jgi:hypothetical protein
VVDLKQIGDGGADNLWICLAVVRIQVENGLTRRSHDGKTEE